MLCVLTAEVILWTTPSSRVFFHHTVLQRPHLNHLSTMCMWRSSRVMPLVTLTLFGCFIDEEGSIKGKCTSLSTFSLLLFHIMDVSQETSVFLPLSERGSTSLKSTFNVQRSHQKEMCWISRSPQSKDNALVWFYMFPLLFGTNLGMSLLKICCPSAHRVLPTWIEHKDRNTKPLLRLHPPTCSHSSFHCCLNSVHLFICLINAPCIIYRALHITSIHPTCMSL